ncbi:MAG: SLC13 family permease [Candidatus Rokuibacteriota bacterium]
MSAGHGTPANIADMPAKWWFGGCIILAALMGVLTRITTPTANLLAIEVFATILALFVFGSIRFRIHKNAITYGAFTIILVTFLPIWWPHSQLREEMAQRGAPVLWEAFQHHALTIHGLEKLIHGDTMLFILGLTFFVSVISQTRLLESISMNILRIFQGRVLPTVLIIAGLVSFASGILDGVSMIGLTIRVLVIILVMARLRYDAIEFAIMVSVVLTTVCGMWLAYGEPPNLIMKSNLGLTDGFFLKYTLPMAVVAFIIVAAFINRWLRKVSIPLDEMDVLERNLADVRFLQAARRGEIRDADEMLEAYAHRLGEKASRVNALYHEGHHPISAMFRADVDDGTINSFIEEYLGEEFIEPVANYYRHRLKRADPGELGKALVEEGVIEHLLEDTRLQERAAQTWAKLAFIPFVALLLWHAWNHEVPLFVSSAAAFAFAFLGILPHPNMRRLALRDAAHEYQEYLFLFPLFLSITMLTAVGFFDELKAAVERGAETLGHGHVAVIQFFASGVLSALLDNNVVADFASRAIQGTPHMFVFAAAQIAGYATGGSLTHIGSAQSVVAFAYILRHIDPDFTPLGWVRAMWKLVLAISLALTAALYLLAALH